MKAAQHLQERAVEITQMVVSKIPNGKPQILLRDGAEDLSGGALMLGLFRTKQDAPAPGAVLGVPEGEPNKDTLSFKPYGGEIVNDSFVWCLNRLTCRLCGHVEPWAGLGKDYRDRGVTQYVRGSGS
jgi:hypothetical protein